MLYFGCNAKWLLSMCFSLEITVNALKTHIWAVYVALALTILGLAL
jgi:hypothetical protein